VASAAELGPHFRDRDSTEHSRGQQQLLLLLLLLLLLHFLYMLPFITMTNRQFDSSSVAAFCFCLLLAACCLLLVACCLLVWLLLFPLLSTACWRAWS